MMNIKEKNFVSAVVYVHNAERQIGRFLEMIIQTMEDNFEHSEVICVNDSSEDHSLEEIKKIGATAKTASISVINMSGFHGLELAVNAGVDMAIGDYIFEFDNVCQDFAASVIMDIYHHSLTGYDIVSASPDRRERLTSRIFYSVFDWFSERASRMCTESFRVLSRRAVNRIGSTNKTVLYRKAVYANCGLKTDHIKYQTNVILKNYIDKKEKRYRLGLAVDSLILFTELGYRFSVTLTVFMMMMSIFMVIYSVIIYTTAHPVAGWTTTILFLSVAFFGVFGVMTVVIKYLQLLVDLMFKRKHYSYESVEKLSG